MTRIPALVRDRRGTATIEFALASLFMFGILMVGLDFAFYSQQNLRLGNAVEQGAVIAFNQRTSSTVDTTSIGNYVSAVAGGSPTMAYQCNGSACSSTQSSQCIVAPATAADWPTFTAPTTVSGVSTCTSGAAPGYYLVIRATKTYQAIAVPDKYLGGKSMMQQAVVRLA